MSSDGRYHWSNTALPAKFFGLSAVTGLPWLMLIIYPRLITIALAIATTIFFLYLEWVKKMSVSDFIRSLNIKLTGKKKGTNDIIRRFL